MKIGLIKKIITFLCLTCLIFAITGCASAEEQKSESLFKKAERCFDDGGSQEAKNMIDEYLIKYPKGKEIEKIKWLSQKVNNRLFAEKQVQVGSETVAGARGRMGNAKVEVTIVDTNPGQNFITIALYIQDPTKDKIIIAIDDFKKQSSGWGHLIYIVKDTDYQLINKRSLGHKVLAVYASTTKNLEILNSNGEVKEEIKL